MVAPTLELDRVTRSYGLVTAVHDASVRFEPGSVVAIVGENGAGKSTLLALAGGDIAPTSGHVIVGGRQLSPPTPAEAIRRGIGFVHQHFMLVEAFTAMENILLGYEPMRSFGRLDLAIGRSRALTVLREVGLHFDLDARVSDLGIGERQHLEIARVLVRGARILLLDEPTAVLTPAQASGLYATLRKAAGAGACVVVVTHRLQEVLSFCDSVVVMRRGHIVHQCPVHQTTSLDLARHIMGCDPPPLVARPPRQENASVALELRDLHVANASGSAPSVDGFSLRVPAGAILGLAGIEGNGQQELVRAIAGTLAITSGEVLLGGQNVSTWTVAQRRAAGLAVVHDDRHREGLLLDVCVADNLVLGDLEHAKDEPALVGKRMGAYRIAPADPQMHARQLSGGNQQKVVVARALDRKVTAAVLAHPTRGVDFGAARSIHEAIIDTAKRGASVLVISADLAELRELCHEVAVISRGRVVAVLPPETPEEVFGQAMLGEVAA